MLFYTCIHVNAESYKYPDIGIESGTYRYKEAKPVDDQLFSKIDSIIENTDFQLILNILNDSITYPFEKMPKLYMDSVVDNYKFYSISYLNGDSLIFLEQPYPVYIDFDYALSIIADDSARTNGFRLKYPELWNYSFVKDNRTYLLYKLMESVFEETDGVIEIEKYWNPADAIIPIWNATLWTFLIKDEKLAGAFITFLFGDGPVNPAWDLINKRFIHPKVYMMERERDGYRIPYDMENQYSE